MQIIETKGNQDLMNREKTLFLCSKMTPIGLYEQVFRWTDSLTTDDCVACFNSTDMESEVLKALLVGGIPTVLFVMNRFTDVNNIQIERALKEGRLLIVVLKRDEPWGKGSTPRLRNEYVLSLCQHVVCGYVNFSKTRRMPVTIIIGVGGESCYPELLYVIPLESISAVVSRTKPIMDFLNHSHILDLSLFIRG